MNETAVNKREGRTSIRASALIEATRNGTVRYSRRGIPILPGESNYSEGLPIKYTLDGWGVTPGDREYATALLHPPEDAKQTLRIKPKIEIQMPDFLKKLINRK